MREIYRSETLSVRSFPGGDVDRWFITFDHVGHDPSLDRPGFGEDYFGERGLSLISVVPRGNDWYQYPDMVRALAAIRQELRGAQTKIAYGCSMGGYAAVRFADAIGATACIALSPQYSNDMRKVPFEKRWTCEAQATRWRADLDGPIRCRIAPVIVYDSRDDDDRHAALIARDTPTIAIALPYTSHPVSTYLGAAGLLNGLIDAVYEERLDAATFASIARERRKSTPFWIAELARRQPPHRAATAIRLARHALDLQPGSDLLLHILAQILTEQARHGEALELHRQSYEQSGRRIEHGMAYSSALYTAGSAPEALNLALGLRNGFPHSALLLRWIAELHARLGSLDSAIGHAEAAITLSLDDAQRPAKIAYHQMLLDKRRALSRRRIGRRALSWLRAGRSRAVRARAALKAPWSWFATQPEDKPQRLQPRPR